MAVNLLAESAGLRERRRIGALAVVAAFVDQLCRGRLDARAEHARAEADFLLRRRQRQMRVGQELADFAKEMNVHFIPKPVDVVTIQTSLDRIG